MEKEIKTHLKGFPLLFLKITFRIYVLKQKRFFEISIEFGLGDKVIAFWPLFLFGPASKSKEGPQTSF